MVTVRTQILWSEYKLGSCDKSRSNSLASVAKTGSEKAKDFTLPVAGMNDRPHSISHWSSLPCLVQPLTWLHVSD